MKISKHHIGGEKNILKDEDTCSILSVNKYKDVSTQIMWLNSKQAFKSEKLKVKETIPGVTSMFLGGGKAVVNWEKKKLKYFQTEAFL